ncbi:MAG: hypothetical protein P8P30_03845 [Rickettsiales bacterium]|nr:hypothetical protein [Rickettsiales bacterium]
MTYLIIGIIFLALFGFKRFILLAIAVVVFLMWLAMSLQADVKDGSEYRKKQQAQNEEWRQKQQNDK